jgi:hypothetical protein
MKSEDWAAFIATCLVVGALLLILGFALLEG